jgi:carbon-monoxide dehydrogenase catalytic subunit
VNSNDPLEPMLQRLTEGEIYGIVLFVGCNNYKVVQDLGFLDMARKLARDNVLMLATGCAAGVFAKNGFMSPQATLELCGDRIRRFLEELGSAAGFGRPLPPVWHLGSCVDHARSVRLCFAIASRLGVDLDQLPVVLSAPEVMSEKSVAMVTWSVALGLTAHLGIIPPVFGGKIVTKVLTETLKDILGAHFMVETDPDIAYQKIKETLTEKRIGLGLK